MYIILGKEDLPKGYSHNLKHFTDDEYEETINIMEGKVPSGLDLRSISLTPIDMANEFDGRTIPTIVNYDPNYDSIFDPKEIWKNCLIGSHVPSVDFVIFNGENHRVPCKKAFAIYSRTAPIIIFEDEYGKIVAGTLLKQQLFEYGRYFFREIMKVMNGKVDVYIPTSTHYSYIYGTLPGNIKEMLMHNSRVTKVSIGYDTEKCPSLFGHKDMYDNCVVVW